MKYPYTLDEYEQKAVEIFKKDYPKQYELIDKKEMKEEIEKSYNGDKYKYENGITKETLELENEVRGAVFKLSMF